MAAFFPQMKTCLYVVTLNFFFWIPIALAKICFLTRECAHAHERAIAIMVFSLGRLVGRLVGSVVNFRACAVNEF